MRPRRVTGGGGGSGAPGLSFVRALDALAARAGGAGGSAWAHWRSNLTVTKSLHRHVEGKNVPLVPRSTIFPNFHETVYFHEMVYFHETSYFQQMQYFHRVSYFQQLNYFHIGFFDLAIRSHGRRYRTRVQSGRPPLYSGSTSTEPEPRGYTCARRNTVNNEPSR